MKKYSSKKDIPSKIVTRVKKFRASEETLKAAWYKVRRELRGLGLMVPGSPLDEVQCIRDGVFTVAGMKALWPLSPGMGWFYPSDENIHVPSICGADIYPWCSEGRCLADVLRHEYGHALEGKYPKFIHNNEFRKAFGKAYGDKKSSDINMNHYVSTYAMTCPQEDFAETFMHYMKYRGILPGKWAKVPAIRRKWSFIDQLRKKIITSGK